MQSFPFITITVITVPSCQQQTFILPMSDYCLDSIPESPSNVGLVWLDSYDPGMWQWSLAPIDIAGLGKAVNCP